jgi:hypothetical protein
VPTAERKQRRHDIASRRLCCCGKGGLPLHALKAENAGGWLERSPFALDLREPGRVLLASFGWLGFTGARQGSLATVQSVDDVNHLSVVHPHSRPVNTQHFGFDVDSKCVSLSRKLSDGRFIHMQDGNSHLLRRLSLQPAVFGPGQFAPRYLRKSHKEARR